jgi:hypothetical protein
VNNAAQEHKESIRKKVLTGLVFVSPRDRVYEKTDDGIQGIHYQLVQEESHRNGLLSHGDIITESEGPE